jgi:pSer/pThr/pTyr-binding forkhead associated (FHA) protein
VQIEDLIPLALRIGFVVILYYFLFRVVAAVRNDVRRGPATPETPRQVGPILEVLQPAGSSLQRGQLISVDASTTMGRESDNRVVIADDSVSGKHAVLQRDGKAWVLRDLGSTNGTRVNDRDLSGTIKLKSGDVIELGRVTLRFADGQKRTSGAGAR